MEAHDENVTSPDIEALASEVARVLRTRLTSPAAVSLYAGRVSSPDALASSIAGQLSSPAALSALASAVAAEIRRGQPPVDPAPPGLDDLADRIATAVRREIEEFSESVLQIDPVDVGALLEENEEASGKEDKGGEGKGGGKGAAGKTGSGKSAEGE